jgi:hypothetical protein
MTIIFEIVHMANCVQSYELGNELLENPVRNLETSCILTDTGLITKKTLVKCYAMLEATFLTPRIFSSPVVNVFPQS